MSRSCVSKAGFSLVEVVLAILVVAVGLLSAFALFPTGMAAGKAAIDETRSAIFAQEVLNGVQAYAAATNGYGGWSSLESMSLEAPTYGKWENGASLTVQANSGPQTLVYSFIGSEIVNHGLRCDLQIKLVPGTTNIKSVRLEVWNGEFGPVDESTVFYTEIFSTGS